MSETKRFREFFNTVGSAMRRVENSDAPSVQHVFVVRHGDRTDDDKTWDEPILRPWDPKITPKGIRRAYETGLEIKAIMERQQGAIQHVVSSPFMRCLQTAEEISKGLGLQKTIAVQNGVGELMSARIVRDWDRGLIAQQGLVYTSRERERRFGDRFPEHPRQPEMTPIDVGETRYPSGGGYRRFRDNINEIASHESREHTVIVTHGDGVAAAVGLALPDVQVYESEFCSFVHLVRDLSSSDPAWRIAQNSGDRGVSWFINIID